MERSVIFDLDNTLVKSESLWPEIDCAAFTLLAGEEKWLAWKPRWKELKRTNVLLDNSLEEFKVFSGIRLDVPEIKAIRERHFFETYAKNLEPMAGAHEIIELLDSNGVSLAVASGMSLPIIRFALSKMGWEKKIKVIASTHETGKNKPHPSVYLLASERLDIDPRTCIAVENEFAGVRAAKAAGMRCIAVPDREQEKEAIIETADEVLESLYETKSMLKHL